MMLGQLSAGELSRRLGGPGLALRTGPFNVRVHTRIADVRDAMTRLYDAYPLAGDDEFCDFSLELLAVGGLRRWIAPQVRVLVDGLPTFEPLPIGHAFALLEWSMNWTISSHAHQYLLLHAAVVERDGLAVILPAPPGSGKSTLCAGLTQHGWRLLSDELALVALEGGRLAALARPVSLKNESLAVIRAFAPQAVIGAQTRDTAKGTVGHLKARAEHVARMGETAQPRWVVFPRYEAGSAALLQPRAKADAMMELGRNAFNYALLGRAGFRALSDVITASDCFDFRYSRLGDALAVFDALPRGRKPERSVA